MSGVNSSSILTSPRAPHHEHTGRSRRRPAVSSVTVSYTIAACTMLLIVSMPHAVPRVGNAAVGEVGERHASTPDRAQQYELPAPPWPNVRGTCERAEAADRRRGAAQMRTEAAMHRHSHDIRRPGRAVQLRMAYSQRARARRRVLTPSRRRSASSGREPPSRAPSRNRPRRARRPCATPRCCWRRIAAAAVDAGSCMSARAVELAVGHADEHLVAKAERRDDALADDVAEILARERLDQHRQRPVRRRAVVAHARPGRPFEREIADYVAQQRVVRPAPPAGPRLSEIRPDG